MKIIVPRRLLIAAVGFLVLSACSKRPARPFVEGAHMYEHFTQVGEVQAGVIKGDLDSIREPARWIANHEEMGGLPEGSERYLSEMRRLARQAEESDRLDQAGAATARLGDTCGSCHTAFHVGPSLAMGGAAPAGIELPPHMLRHRWASDRMWEGIVGPSEQAWLAGAQALADDPVLTLETGVPGALGQRVHEIGAQALETTDASDRAQLYGELLSTCAPCHGALGIQLK